MFLINKINTEIVEVSGALEIPTIKLMEKGLMGLSRLDVSLGVRLHTMKL